MSKVIGMVVSQTQTAFLKDRFILDGPLIINEVIGWIKKKGEQAFLLKIDFEKAFDNVNWEFLLSILSQMGFPPKWCLWVKGILASARSSVLVNGSPTYEFHCEKGVRQGDPLSPYLFLIVMEALASILSKAMEIGEFEGIRLPNYGPPLSHLFYADDALIMGKCSLANMKTIARLLRIFHLCSGLKINFHKSHLYGMGIEGDDLIRLSKTIGCNIGMFPFEYLGIKVGSNMNRIAHWTPVIDTIQNRLTSWKAKTLSIGGRLTLVKSVLSSLPIYYLSLYRAPKFVIDKMESLMRNFLWAGTADSKKLHWVCWDVVTSPKDDGGLGISKLSDVNLALLLKWAWRFKIQQGSLWRNVIEAIHGGRNRWVFLPLNRSLTGCWKNLVSWIDQLQIDGKKAEWFFKGKPGDGAYLRFWRDRWLGDTLLKDRWPRLYALESNKNCNISDRLSHSGTALLLGPGWNAWPSSVEEISEMNDANYMLNCIRFAGTKDVWKWDEEGSNHFSVANVKRRIRLDRNNHRTHLFKWESWIPLKINIHLWRAEMGRIPTRLALQRRQIIIASTICVLCDVNDEDCNHVFVHCGFAFGVWSLIRRWCKMDYVSFDDMDGLLKFYKHIQGPKWAKKLIRGIVMTTCWAIWNARNKKVFDNISPKVHEVVALVKSLSFLWIKSRSKFKSVVWKDWAVFPLYML